MLRKSIKINIYWCGAAVRFCIQYIKDKSKVVSTLRYRQSPKNCIIIGIIIIFI